MRKLLCATAVVCAMAAVMFSADSGSVARGKYLVEEIGRCQECHTPRLESGELDKSKWLKGATLDFTPTHEIKGWHKTSPNIAGSSPLFQRWKDEGVVKFLETGLNPRGNKADPPMPFYNLKHEDAQDIVEYLKTIQ